VLPDSQVARELTVDDGPVDVHLDITEVDPVYDENLLIHQHLSATDESTTVEGTTQSGYVGSPSCELRYRWDREVTLIVPLPSSGQEIVVKG